MKGKGSAGAVAMGKALISNLTPSKGPGFSGRSGEGLADIFSGKDTGAFVPNKHRAFLMDTQVKYTIVSQISSSSSSTSSLNHIFTKKFPGPAEPGKKSVPLQWPASDRQGAFLLALQIEGPGNLMFF